MKNHICAACLFCFFTCCLSAQSIKTDLSQWTLKGPVSSMEERSYLAVDNFGKAIKGPRTKENSDHLFNRNGQHTEQNIYNQNGSLKVRYTYEYNNGLLVLQVLYNPGGSTRSKLSYHYNNQGKLAEQTQLMPNGNIASRYVYEYDNSGNQVAYNWYNSEGSLDEKYVFTYDANGNQVTAISVNADGTINSKATYKYDESGNVVEEQIEAGTDSLSRKTTFVYERNNVSSSIIYLPGGTVSEQNNFRYDSKNNIIEKEIRDKDDNLLDKYNYKYDYDKQGNWNSKLVLRNGVPLTITERELIYYKVK